TAPAARDRFTAALSKSKMERERPTWHKRVWAATRQEWRKGEACGVLRTQSRGSHMKTHALTTLLFIAAARILAGETPAGPQPKFQGDFFGEMARSFATIVSTDSKAMTMTAKLDKDGSLATLPIRSDTELHFRSSWGELSDYFPGQHVMLFVYVDEDRKWT